MATDIDLTVGLNLEIGSVPVALSAEYVTNDTGSVYTFNGCVQDAAIDIGAFMSYVGQQFGVTVLLPPELDLKAVIDYVAGQVIYTKPKTGATTTELGVSAKFDLVYKNGDDTKTFTFTFYADTIMTDGSNTKTYVVGGSIDFDLKFKDLPLVGSIPVFNEYVLKHLGFSYTNVAPAENGNEPVTFNIPKVKASDNPLYTMKSDDTKGKKTYSIDTEGDQTTFSLSKKGFAFTAGLMKEGSEDAESNFSLPMSLPETPPPTEPASFYSTGKPGVQASPPESPVHWIDINKKFGPIDLQKIGLNYRSGEATFGFTAGFSMGGFSLALQGLTITFPLPLPGMPAGDEVSFDLEGLAMDYKTSGLNIGGAFLKSKQNGITNYFGQAIVQVGNYGFKAIGGFAPEQTINGKNTPASFFIYANLDIPLGGPPFLYVSGLAFGFGVNYALNLPTIETLPGYLLLPSNAPSQPDNAMGAFTGVLSQLAGGDHPVVENQPGQYWVAAGIQFSSFNMVDAFALVTVSFGVEFQIAVLGTASISLPEAATRPLAYIEIDLIASFTPKTGLLAVAGVVSPASYIWGDFVKVTGGFAFYTWFSGPHKGDFVATLGGYNSSYNKPDWYPTVPRLGINFSLGPFEASGSGYIALTPSMFMAGMKVSASFHAGPVKCWFNYGIDFVVSWAPFYYAADAYVNFGCSVDLGLFTISVSVGAELLIWGPPFGGRAEVDLDIVSFTISFGSSSPPDVLPSSWTDVERFLPDGGKRPAPKQRAPKSARMSLMAKPVLLEDSNEDIAGSVSASVSDGLQKKDVTNQAGELFNWIVDPNKFQIVTATSIPANVAKWATGASTTGNITNDLSKYNTQPPVAKPIPYLELSADTKTFSTTKVWNPDLCVTAMFLKDVKSVHTIGILKADNAGNFNQYYTEVMIEPLLMDSNAALWGTPSATKDVNQDTLVSKTLIGFNIFPLPRNPNTTSNVPLIQLLFTQGNKTTFTYTRLQPNPNFTVSSGISPAPDFNLNINVSGSSSQSFVNKQFILSSLINPWVTTQRNSILSDLQANGFSTFGPADVKLDAMGKTEELTDWPMVGLLGNEILPVH